MGALDAVRTDREARWSAADVRARMEFSLKTAYAHGTSLIRTHLDSLPPQHRISFEVFSELRDAWKDRIALQAVALFPLDMITDEPFFRDLIEVVASHGGLLGGVTQMWPDLDQRLDLLFRTASDNGLDIDLHVDETQDREVLTLKAIAEAKLRNRFEGSVTVGHCCSLARQDDDIAAATIDKVAEAGVSVVSLPMCNMYLQDRVTAPSPRAIAASRCSTNWRRPASRPRSPQTTHAIPSTPMAISTLSRCSAKACASFISTIRSTRPRASSPARRPTFSAAPTMAASPPAFPPISCCFRRGAGANSFPVRRLTAS